jgi:hypothetical protein
VVFRGLGCFSFPSGFFACLSGLARLIGTWSVRGYSVHPLSSAALLTVSAGIPSTAQVAASSSHLFRPLISATFYSSTAATSSHTEVHTMQRAPA